MIAQEICDRYTKNPTPAVFDLLTDLNHSSPPTQEDFMNFVDLAEKLWKLTFPKSCHGYDKDDNQFVCSLGLIQEIYLDATIYFDDNKIKLHWAVYPDEEIIILAE